MNCPVAAARIAALVDGELGPVAAWRVRRHVARCAACAAERRALVDLRDTIRADVPPHRAPSAFVDRMRAGFGSPAVGARTIVAARRRAALAGALVGCAATVAVGAAATFVVDRRSEADVVERLVVAHTHAVAADTLVAVGSSDRHRVKPWLSARLDYSPPVVDLAAAGFPLVGGRIDVVDGRPTAVLAYRSREHTIDVFVRPTGDGPFPAAPRTIRGFNVRAARGAGMDWIAVSDVNAPALAELLRRLSRPDDGPA